MLDTEKCQLKSTLREIDSPLKKISLFKANWRLTKACLDHCPQELATYCHRELLKRGCGLLTVILKITNSKTMELGIEALSAYT